MIPDMLRPGVLPGEPFERLQTLCKLAQFDRERLAYIWRSRSWTQSAMHRLVAVLLVVVAAVAAGPAAGVPTVGADARQAETADDSPGTALSGAIAVHGSDLESEIEARSLRVALQRADRAPDPQQARAMALAQHLDIARQRVATLEDRRAALVEAHEAGQISDRAYRVRATALTAEVRAQERFITRTRSAARALPNQTRVDHGLEAATYRSLLNRTHNVTAGEFAATSKTFDARMLAPWNGSMAWNSTWTASSPWNGSLNDSNISDAMAARFDHADGRIDTLRSNRSSLEQYDDGDDPAVQEALACARDQLDEASAAIDDARMAAERGDEEAMRRHLDDAESHLRQAAECLAQGWEAARDDDSTRSTDSKESSWNGSDNWTYDSSKSG